MRVYQQYRKPRAKRAISRKSVDRLVNGLHPLFASVKAPDSERLSERATDRKKSGNFSPREGSTTTQTKAEPLREFTRGLFGREE